MKIYARRAGFKMQAFLLRHTILLRKSLGVNYVQITKKIFSISLVLGD